MQLKTLALAAATVTFGAAALAHADVANPVVKERMALMGEIRTNFATLGGMVQGKTAFDAATAAEAKAALAAAAAMIPAKFEANETDPESEAAPAIWDDWEGFTADAADFEAAVAALDTASLESVQAGFRPIGGSCGACHQAYRVD